MPSKMLDEGGVRYMTLTWNNGNDWAGSSIGTDGTRTGGLTPFDRGYSEDDVHKMLGGNMLRAMEQVLVR
jgi:microsomal dipeptidase-like Zn-dependent dipeptidase